MTTLRNYVNDTKKNINILETGTARGFSTIIMSYILNEFNKNFSISTLDIISHEKKIYWNCISDIKKGKVTRKILLTDYSNYLKNINFISGISKNILINLNLLGKIPIKTKLMESSDSGKPYAEFFNDSLLFVNIVKKIINFIK